MRTRLISLVLLAGLATPAAAQTCKKAPLPSIPELFPESVEGMGRQFYNRMDQCFTNIYRPAGEAGGAPWAVVSIEPHEDPFLGEAVSDLLTHYERTGCRIVDVDGWPVAFNRIEAGDEFVALRGNIRVTVLVKNGDNGDGSIELATALFSAILPRVPCA